MVNFFPVFLLLFAMTYPCLALIHFRCKRGSEPNVDQNPMFEKKILD